MRIGKSTIYLLFFKMITHMYSKKMALLALSIAMLTIACNRKMSSRSGGKTMVYSELKNMWVDKGPYYKGESIKVFFADGHPEELGIKSPNGDFYYLVYIPGLETIPNASPLVSQTKFKKMKEIELIAGVTRANPHNIKYKSNQPIFTQSGIYTLLLSKNLSTDAAGPAETIQIEYRHQSRPPQS